QSRDGDSIARWEGDTLVVETTNVHSDSPVRVVPGSTPMILRDSAKLVERFSLVARDEILYQFSVEDPEFYSRQWTAEFSMVRTPKRQFENAGQEGNYALTNTLQGARQNKKRATQPAGQTQQQGPPVRANGH